jgi:hypothetical protein
MPYDPGARNHGPSIHSPETYNALMRKGMSQGKAAAISNSAFNKTGKKGRHHRRKRG